MTIWEKLRGWHEDQIYGFQKITKLDDYHMYWISFAEGILLTLIFMWII